MLVDLFTARRKRIVLLGQGSEHWVHSSSPLVEGAPIGMAEVMATGGLTADGMSAAIGYGAVTMMG